jgi:ATP-binding cassette subfamily B protein
MRVIFRIFKLVYRRYKYHVIFGYISVVGAALSALAIPKVLGSSIDRALSSGEQSTSVLLLLAGALLLAGLARGLFTLGQTYFAESISQRFAYVIRNEFYDKLQYLSFAFHDRQGTGSLMSRATSDVEGVRQFINMGAIRLGFVAAMMIGVTIAILLTDLKLGLISLAFVPLLAWRAIVTSRSLRKIYLRVQELIGDMVAALQENLSGIRVVKAFGAEEYELEKFRKKALTVADENFRADARWARNFSTLNFMFVAATGAVLWVGGAEVIAGRSGAGGTLTYSGLTPGELTSVIFYLGLLLMPVRIVGWMVNSFSRAASCGERLFEVLDAVSPVEERPNARPLGRARGSIVFDHVTMAYDGRNPALIDISVAVEPGQVVALVGRPGSGKTTFAHLIPRFYDATSGHVTIDGIDVRDVTLASLRDNIGVVQQDVFIYTASIRDNIAYGRASATQAEVERVARIAQLHEFIMTLPDKYATVVGERGVGLSGGQKQRLSIARTLLRDPPVLILDDSTSSVDAHTEHLIQQGLEKVINGRTTFIITNRISSLRHAGLILVFKDGRIVERGTHQKLLALAGEYRELYEAQMRERDRFGLATGEASVMEAGAHESHTAAQADSDRVDSAPLREPQAGERRMPR